MTVSSSLALGIVAHVDAGKTSLTERLLFEAGATDHLGSVDGGDTQTDTMELERRRGITIRSAVASFERAGVRVDVVDTPGHSDFIAEVERALSVLDAAVLVVSGVEGVQAQTVALHRVLHRLAIPTIIFVNKMDRPDANLAAVEAAIRRRLTDDPGPILSGSAVTGAGVTQLLDALTAHFVPSRWDAAEPARGVIWRIARGSRGEKQAVVRVHGGTLRVRDQVHVGGIRQKVTELRTADGRGRVTTVSAGEFGAVVGWTKARVGETFGHTAVTNNPENQCDSRTQQFAKPSLEAVIDVADPAQRPALHDGLAALAEVDPLIDVRLDDALGEIHVSLYGEVQKEVIASLLESEFGVVATFGTSSVICTERVRGSGAAVEIINTPTNPFLATVGVRVESAPVGAGRVIRLEVERGSMPPAFFSAVEEGIEAGLAQGVHGWRVPDATVTITHSGYWPRQSAMHATFDKSMSSTAADFRLLTPLLVVQSLLQAGTVVCEPIETFVLDVPETAFGAVMSRLAHHDAIALETVGDQFHLTITGTIPAASIHGLRRELPDLTKGEGVLTTEPSHDDPVTGRRPPERTRTDDDPTDRDRYLRAVAPRIGRLWPPRG